MLPVVSSSTAFICALGSGVLLSSTQLTWDLRLYWCQMGSSLSETILYGLGVLSCRLDVFVAGVGIVSAGARVKTEYLLPLTLSDVASHPRFFLAFSSTLRGEMRRKVVLCCCYFWSCSIIGVFAMYSLGLAAIFGMLVMGGFAARENLSAKFRSTSIFSPAMGGRCCWMRVL